MSSSPSPPPFTHALLAGGIAGTTVDLTLFPLDTLKTRLQSSEGFFASGGFKGIYRGVGSAALGSAPGAAFFFCTYEATKTALAEARRQTLGGGSSSASAAAATQQGGGSGNGHAVDHMLAASLGEVAACSVRVPTEVVKQRAQAGQHGGSSLSSLMAILGRRHAVGLPGVWRELYRGWGITIMREVPFTVIQFPLWEALKSYSRRRQPGGGSGGDVSAGESALYGSISGAVAAGVTTPLDVLKTRVMLSTERQRVWDVVTGILRQHGVRPFFAGIGPRVMWISIGGAVFLGSYQWAINAFERGKTGKAAVSLP
ncbi:PET8 related protein [Diaporthe amygdali]|uniref:PET8 related protein n=1 Tax=Phomopsis amygdali TaxID=1214568 RepID=UPI0022FE86F4|nr:PET8 related protein [Diaporthe amygdali]KAJ0124726.1 PET8 related protein [Diaporthe amygdali]